MKSFLYSFNKQKMPQKKLAFNNERNLNGGTMKSLIFFLGLCLGLTSWAFDSTPSEFERKSWSEIEADNSLFVNWPMVMGIPINKVCLTKDKIKALEPIRSCREWKVSSASECKNKTDWCYTTNEQLYEHSYPANDTYHKCMKIDINKKAQISRLMTSTTCVENSSKQQDFSDIEYLKCTKYKIESYTFPQVHNVRITDYRQQNGETFNWAYKNYAIPLCH